MRSGLSGILKGKQNLGVTFNFDKQDVIDFTIDFAALSKFLTTRPQPILKFHCAHPNLVDSLRFGFGKLEFTIYLRFR